MPTCAKCGWAEAVWNHRVTCGTRCLAAGSSTCHSSTAYMSAKPPLLPLLYLSIAQRRIPVYKSSANYGSLQAD